MTLFTASITFMRKYFFHAFLFGIVFVGIGILFFSFHRYSASHVQEYIEQGSPIIVVVDNEIIYDIVHHIVGDRSRIVMVGSIGAIDQKKLQEQIQPSLSRARYIFISMTPVENGHNSAIISASDFIDEDKKNIVEIDTLQDIPDVSSTILLYRSVTSSPSAIGELSKRYFWTSPHYAQEIVAGVARTLGANDLVNKTFFINNSYDYSAQIAMLYDNGYLAQKMKDKEAIIFGAGYMDFVLDFQLKPVVVIDSPVISADEQKRAFVALFDALKKYPRAMVIVPDDFPKKDFYAFVKKGGMSLDIVSLINTPQANGEGYLDITQENIVRLQEVLF